MIRFIVGLFVVFGAVGGMDNATDGQLLPLLGLAIVGLALMYFGTEKMKEM
jgi:hypothetical protein